MAAAQRHVRDCSSLTPPTNRHAGPTFQPSASPPTAARPQASHACKQQLLHLQHHTSPLQPQPSLHPLPHRPHLAAAKAAMPRACCLRCLQRRRRLLHCQGQVLAPKHRPASCCVSPVGCRVLRRMWSVDSWCCLLLLLCPTANCCVKRRCCATALLLLLAARAGLAHALPLLLLLKRALCSRRAAAAAKGAVLTPSGCCGRSPKPAGCTPYWAGGAAAGFCSTTTAFL